MVSSSAPGAPVRTAIVVGFGKMGMLHAATLRMLGVPEVVICEPSPLIQAGVRAFTPDASILSDYREALRAGPVDVAVIATPTASHAPIFRDIAPRVRGVFIEKPFAQSADVAREALATLPEERRPGVMVGHCLRFAIPFIEADRLLRAGVLGRVEHVHATMFSSDVLRPARGWRANAQEAGGGVLLDLGSHLVDIVRMLFGSPQRLRATLTSVVSRHTEDAFRSDWQWDGFDGVLDCSWSNRFVRKATLEVRVTGSNGTVFVSDDVVELALRAPAASPAGVLAAGAHRFPITALERTVPFDLAAPMYTRQLQAWLAAVERGEAATNGIDENVEDLRVIDLIRASQGEWVEVRP